MSIQNERSPLLNSAKDDSTNQSNSKSSEQHPTANNGENSNSLPKSTLDGRSRSSLPQHIRDEMSPRQGQGASSAAAGRSATPQPTRPNPDAQSDPGRRRSATPMITVTVSVVDSVSASEARSEIDRLRPRAQAILSGKDGNPRTMSPVASPPAAAGKKKFGRFVSAENPRSPKLSSSESPQSPKLTTTGNSSRFAQLNDGFDRPQTSTVKIGGERRTNKTHFQPIRDARTPPPTPDSTSAPEAPFQRSALAHHEGKHSNQNKRVRITLPPAPENFNECGLPARRTDRVNTIVGAKSSPGESINDSGTGEGEPLLGADGRDGGEPSADENEPEFVVYKWRWYMLLVLAALTALTSADWIAFAPIADNVASFMDVSPDRVNLLSLVFFITMLMLPYSFLCTQLLERYGLRVAFWLGGLLLALGSAIRLFALVPDRYSPDTPPTTTSLAPTNPGQNATGTTNFVPSTSPVWDAGSGPASVLDDVCGWLSAHRFASVLVGQTIIALSQPFALFSGTKLASAWFPEDQRAFANMVATLSQILGVMSGSLLAPILVPNANDVWLVLVVFGAPSLPLLIAIALGVTASLPPTPPAPSAAAALTSSSSGSATSTGVGEEGEGAITKGWASFWHATKYAFSCPPFVIILVSFGISSGAFNAYTTLAAQILCINGYSDRFTGLAITLQMLAGLVGGVAVTFYVDRSKHYMETVKVSAALGLVGNAILMNLVLHPGFQAAILTTVIFVGVVGLSVGPLFLELGIEATYPHVGEVVNNTLILISAQFFSVLFLVLAPMFGQLATDEQAAYSVCANQLQQVDYTWTNVFILLTSSISSILVVGFFRTELRRIAFDKAPRFNVRTRSVSVSFRYGRVFEQRQRRRAMTIGATSVTTISEAAAAPDPMPPPLASGTSQPLRDNSESDNS